MVGIKDFEMPISCAKCDIKCKYSYDAGYSFKRSNDCPLVEAISKDQYEARLKADMVAMLTDIQLEIEELKNEPACCHHFVRGIRRSSEVIQQKIDALKAENELQESENNK